MTRDSMCKFIYEVLVSVCVYLVVAFFYWEKGLSPFGFFFLLLIVLFSVPIYFLIHPIENRLPENFLFYPKDKVIFTASMFCSALLVSLFYNKLGLI